MRQILLVLAMAAAAMADTRSTDTRCTTRLDTVRHARVPTYWYRWTSRPTVTIKNTVTPTTTVTPAPTTVTETTTTTSTHVVDVQSTDTFTSTSMVTTTQTSTETSTITSTSSTTTTTTTSTTTTIAPSAGFTAIKYQADYQARRVRRSDVEEEERAFVQAEAREEAAAEAFAERRAAQSKLAFPKLGAVATPAHYPAAVTCAQIVRETRTATTTLTAAAVATTLPVVTSTDTATVSTNTEVTSTLADATEHTISTVTETASTTTTATTSTTTTVTNTAVLPFATFYAQCGPENILSRAHGLPIGNIAYTSAFTMAAAVVADTSGYGCCALCAQTDGCAGYGQYPNGGSCYYLISGGQCDGSKSFGDTYRYYAIPRAGYTVGNGGCGAFAAKYGPVSSV